MADNPKVIRYPDVRLSVVRLGGLGNEIKLMEHIFDSGPGFRAVAQNVPEMAQN